MLDARLLPPGIPVLAACSGGADSVGLLLALVEIRQAGGGEVVVGHVHHGLRGSEADAEAELVRSVAEGLGVRVVERRVDAAAAAAHRRRGLEEGARHVRREALEDMADAAECAVIALAHTADDQAETLLLRLLRGAGAEGLAGMPARAGRVVRPLLRVRRSETRAAVAQAGLPWASDPTNWSPTSARAQVRELLERLEAVLDEGVVERLCETADQLRDDCARLDEEAEQLLRPRLIVERGSEGVPRARVRDAAAIGSAAPALRRRAVRRLLRDLRPGVTPPSADAVARASRLFSPPPGPNSALLAGLALRRAGPDVVAGPEGGASVPTLPVPLEVGATLRWGRGVLGCRRAGDAEPPGTAERVRLDPRAVLPGLVVRPRRPGDRLFRGRDARRVTDLLAGLGVPAAWRDAQPLVCLAPEAATIVWLPGRDADPRFLAAEDCPDAVELWWSAAEPGAGVPA